MKNKKLERTLDALDGIFNLKKAISKSISKAKDQATEFGIQSVGLAKEFSDSIEELFKADDPPKTPTDRD